MHCNLEFLVLRRKLVLWECGCFIDCNLKGWFLDLFLLLFMNYQFLKFLSTLKINQNNRRIYVYYLEHSFNGWMVYSFWLLQQKSTRMKILESHLSNCVRHSWEQIRSRQWSRRSSRWNWRVSRDRNHYRVSPLSNSSMDLLRAACQVADSSVGAEKSTSPQSLESSHCEPWTGSARELFCAEVPTAVSDRRLWATAADRYQMGSVCPELVHICRSSWPPSKRMESKALESGYDNTYMDYPLWCW